MSVMGNCYARFLGEGRKVTSDPYPFICSRVTPGSAYPASKNFVENAKKISDLTNSSMNIVVETLRLQKEWALNPNFSLGKLVNYLD